MGKKLTREQAEAIAEELLSQQPRHKGSHLAKALPVLSRLLESRPMLHDPKPCPFTSPASPLKDVMNRRIDTSKN